MSDLLSGANREQTGRPMCSDCRLYGAPGGDRPRNGRRSKSCVHIIRVGESCVLLFLVSRGRAFSRTKVRPSRRLPTLFVSQEPPKKPRSEGAQKCIACRAGLERTQVRDKPVPSCGLLLNVCPLSLLTLVSEGFLRERIFYKMLSKRRIFVHSRGRIRAAFFYFFEPSPGMGPCLTGPSEFNKGMKGLILHCPLSAGTFLEFPFRYIKPEAETIIVTKDRRRRP